MSQIEQRDINNAAWAACDTFRGTMDPGQYKDYILVMLFIKRISDVWQDHYDEYHAQFGDDETRIQRRLERERFNLPEVTTHDPATGNLQHRFRASFHSLYDLRNDPNIGEIINATLDAIEAANKHKLKGVFRNIDFNSEANLGKKRDRNRRLKQLLEDLNKPQLDMRPSRVAEDVIGNTYIYLIERFAYTAGKKAGEFYTPHKVAELVAKLAAPKKGDRICDPTCGSGGLLLEAGKQVEGQDYALFGMEANGSTWALAMMNMFLHGADNARIEWCNTLINPSLVEDDKLMTFDVAVANPPFSLDKWGAEDAESDKYKRFWRGTPPKSRGDWAFICHMIETAEPKKGRAVIVVPHGVLFRGGSEGKLRRQVIEENLLDTVITLPQNLFPSTSIPVAIIIIDRSREPGGANEHRKDILFISAEQGFVPGKNQNSLSDEHIECICTAYKGRNPIKEFAYIAGPDEVHKNDFTLNAQRYVSASLFNQNIDTKALQKSIDELENELLQVRKNIREVIGQLEQ